MNWADWKKRLGWGVPTRAARFVLPTLALEVEPGFVAGARLDASGRGVQRAGFRALAPGALMPSLHKPNVTDGAAIRAAIAEVANLVGNPGGTVGLLIPDVAARVALLQFETLPNDRREAESLVRWRLREFLPFAPDEARLSYQVLVNEPGAVEILGVAVRASVLAEYEAALGGINGGPGLVLPVSVALLPLIPEDDFGQLLLHLCPGALTAVVLRLNRVLYWRTRPREDEAGESFQEVAREAGRVLATCQDHLNLRVANIWFCARPPATAEMKNALAKTLGRELRDLPRGRAEASLLPAGERDAFERFGTPFAGLVANVNESR